MLPVQVFCEEVKGRSGVPYRHFVAASYEALWYRYVAKDTLARHLYEARALRLLHRPSPPAFLLLWMSGPQGAAAEGL